MPVRLDQSDAVRALVCLAVSLLLLLLPGCGGPERARRKQRVADAVDVDDDGGAAGGDVRAPAQKKPIDPARSMAVHLLDVGQGAATLVELPCGAILVDTGAEQNASFDGVAALRRQLEAFFARRTDLRRTLDLVVITHPHVDHLRGLPMVLETFTVKNLVDNGLAGEDNVKDLVAAARRATEGGRVRYRAAVNGEITKKGGLVDDVVDPVACRDVDPQVRVLSGAVDVDPGWGTDAYGHAHVDDMNNHSVVLRVDVGNGSLLITGDLEEVAIRALLKRYRDTRWLDVDVLQVGHHGSHNGTTRELLVATSPLVALIACGPASREEDWSAWTYGHPRASVIELLLDAVQLPRSPVPVPVARGVKRFENRVVDRAIYATGWDGAVVVDLDAAGTVQVR